MKPPVPSGIKTYREFWPYYVTEHLNPKNRRLHFIGTFCIFIILALALYLNDARVVIALPFVSYGFAWFGHFFIEKNKPATFKYPFFSLMGDFQMFYCMMTGRMKEEIQRSVEHVKTDRPQRIQAET